MKQVVLITYAFPYSIQEPFLETEIKYWNKQNNIELIIMPIIKNSMQREISTNIYIDDFLTNRFNFILTKILFMFKSLLHMGFLQELKKVFLNNPNATIYSLHSYAKYLFYKKELEIYIKSNKNKDLVFYTYWYTEITYALQSLKNKYKFKLITRVHGTDLYKERKPYNYMPLRKHFLTNIDKIYTLTSKANDYLTLTYGYNKNLIEISRLGVTNHQTCTYKTDDNTYHIVSCSNLIKLKQIDKLIDSLYELSLIMKEHEIHIYWTHVGSGILYKKITEYAKKQLVGLSNLSYTFKGELKNEDVHNFYKQNKIDVFINVSLFEGVPVTIMEAMSYHIPVVAPNIGGIEDMVTSGYNGVLMSSQPTISEITDALKKIYLFKNDECRNNAYNIFKEKYNASINYVNFINSLSK